MRLRGSRGCLGEGLLRPDNQGPKRLRLARREIREHLAVDLDAGALDAVHELRIGQVQAELAHAGIDALDPQSAEAALLVAPVAIGIAQALLDLLEGDPVIAGIAIAIALGELEDLLVTGV